MGYSTSKVTLEKLLPYLDPLKKGEPTVWTVKDMTAKQFCYKIREALSIVRRYPEDYPELAKFAPHYTITEIPGTNSVKASLKPEVSVLVDGSIAVQTVSTAALTKKPGADSSVVGELKGVQTPLALVEAWARRGSAPRLLAPQAGLSSADLSKLYAWAQKQNPVVLLFVTPSGGVSLRQTTDCTASECQLAWTPEDE